MLMLMIISRRRVTGSAPFTTRMAFVEVDVELVLLTADLLVCVLLKFCEEGVTDLDEGFYLNIVSYARV